MFLREREGGGIIQPYIFFFKKKEILLFAVTWIDPEGIMLREISNIEKDKHHMLSHIYGI